MLGLIYAHKNYLYTYVTTSIKPSYQFVLPNNRRIIAQIVLI